MTLKEELVKNTKNYSQNEFDDRLVLTKVAKGFIKDYKVYGENTVDLYKDVFGEEFSTLFECFDENVSVLTEELNEDTTLLFEGDYDNLKNTMDPTGELSAGLPNGGFSPPKSSLIKGAVAGAAASVAKKASAAGEKGKGLLSSIWNTVKGFGAKLAEKFPKVAGFLSKGIDWIVANPLLVAGAAGGTLLLGALIRALNKRGDAKKAAKLQNALDKAKEKGDVKGAVKAQLSLDKVVK